MSFITTASSRSISTLSRTTSATSASTLESSPPLTPPEPTFDKFSFDAQPKTLCASPESLDDLWTSGSTLDNHAYARALLPAGFTFPTLADVRSKTPVPYRDPFVNCRTSEDFRAIDALAAVHFAALKVQQTRESRLREESERKQMERKQMERKQMERREVERKKQRKMFEDAWMCAKGAMSVVLVSGSVLCVLALA